MTHKLITFGDSWTFGDELFDSALAQLPNAYCAMSENDEYRLARCWGGLVARELGLNFENYGFNGMSLQSMVWTATWCMDNIDLSNSIVIVGLTNDLRTSWYDSSRVDNVRPWNTHIHSCWNPQQDPWRTITKLHVENSHSQELNRKNRQQAVMFFDSLAHRYQIPVLQFDCYRNQTNFYSQNHVWPGQCAKDWIDDNCAPGNHPTESGHILISNKLTSWIKSVKLMK